MRRTATAYVPTLTARRNGETLFVAQDGTLTGDRRKAMRCATRAQAVDRADVATLHHLTAQDAPMYRSLALPTWAA